MGRIYESEDFEVLEIETMSNEDIVEILNRSIDKDNYGSYKKFDHKVANLFLEPSTRTMVSFQVAQDNLGLKRYDIPVSNSSMNKKETLYDTLANLEQMGIDFFVIRSSEEKYFEELSEEFYIINAGDGKNSHPTQALLDAATVLKTLGEFNSETKIAYVGDLKHSRVYNSGKILFERLGLDVTGFDVMENESIRGREEEFDIIIMLRVQHERHESTFDTNEYNEKFGLNLDILESLENRPLLMHPGPVNYGVELTRDVEEYENNLILEQVEMGVNVRETIMELLCENM